MELYQLYIRIMIMMIIVMISSVAGCRTGGACWPACRSRCLAANGAQHATKAVSTSGDFCTFSKWTSSLLSGRWLICSTRRRKCTEIFNTENVSFSNELPISRNTDNHIYVYIYIFYFFQNQIYIPYSLNNPRFHHKVFLYNKHSVTLVPWYLTYRSC